MTELLDLAKKLIPCVRAAGEIELKYFKDGVEVIDKSDGSPVTLADQEAEKLISEALKEIAPDIPMVGEESVAAGDIPDISEGTFWLVDPLDGTRDFISGGGEFTVNIALLQNFIPVMGVIYVPVKDILYFGADGQAFISVEGGAEEKIAVREVPKEGLTVVASKRHGDPDRLNEILKGKNVAELINCSSSLKFCSIAEGKADFYPRFKPTCEWDTAAGEAILRAAGGRVTDIDGKDMVYGKVSESFLNTEFIALSS